MALAVQQVAYNDARSVDPTPTLSSGPTAGNLIVAVGWWSGPPAYANINGWTLISDATGASSNGGIGLFTRTAIAGDTGTYGALSSGNTGYNACIVYEISGGAAVDLSNPQVFATPGATNTATSENTGAANDLALFFGFQYAILGGTPSCSLGSAGTSHAGFGAGGVSNYLAVVSSGTAEAPVYTWNDTPTYCGAVTLFLKAGSSTETANPVKLALSGVSFNGGGARTETANPVTLALGGIKYTAAAQFIAESGAVALVLSKVAFKINTVDVTAEPSLVNFYTF